MLVEFLMVVLVPLDEELLGGSSVVELLTVLLFFPLEASVVEILGSDHARLELVHILNESLSPLSVVDSSIGHLFFFLELDDSGLDSYLLIPCQCQVLAGHVHLVLRVLARQSLVGRGHFAHALGPHRRMG